MHKLDFRVYLEKFDLQWYNGSPDKFEVRTLVENSNYKAAYKLDKGQLQPVGNTGYSFAVIDYFPDFGMDENMKAYNRSSLPLNPAVLLRINFSGKPEEERWVFASREGMGLNRDQNIRFRLNYQPMIKEYRSRVRVADENGGGETTADIKVNSPFSHRGYTFYQAGYDRDNPKFTSLEVVRNPGVGFVFAGFLLLNAGLVLVFYPKLKFGAKHQGNL